MVELVEIHMSYHYNGYTCNNTLSRDLEKTERFDFKMWVTF